MRRCRAVLVGILLCYLCTALFCGIGSAEHTPWDCSECGRTGITKNYCGGCGHPAPWIEGESGKLSRDDFSKVGNIVRFGRYEQDNNQENGAEEIEWIVLDAQEGKSLLLSKCGLDAKPYNTSLSNVTWETCTLRVWLNNGFLKAAFTAEEQSSILITTVDNSKDQGYSGYYTNGGNNTQDHFFLLSYHEAFDLYFESNDARMCAPTDFAKEYGAYTNNSYEVDGRSTGWWWLRSPGYLQRNATSVNFDGSSNYSRVNGASGCVRPAFWINLEADIF